jgi:hypothetical protein
MFNASIWVRPAGEPLWKAFAGKQIFLQLIDEPQGEGICLTAKGSATSPSAMAHPPCTTSPRRTISPAAG